MSVHAVFDELFTGATVTIDITRCLDTRHDRAGCRRCADVCPTEAITLQTSAPELDPDRCIRCGACAPVCPTDAVVGADAPERRLIDTCRELDARGVTLACPIHPRPTAPEGWPVVRAGRCLAALSGDQLLAISCGGSRPVSLDLTWCSECPIGPAADAVILTVEATNAVVVLATGRIEPPFLLRVLPADDLVSPATATTGAIVDSRRPSTTRRGMFSALRRRAESAIERGNLPVPAPLRRSRGQVAKRLPQGVPASRTQLLEQLAALTVETAGSIELDGVVAAALVPFADVRVDEDRCSGCSLCARYCPTGALHFDAAGPTGVDAFTLSFRSDTCIDCNICAVACPEGAIDYGDTVTSAMIVRPQRTPLAGAPLVKCSACGLPTATVAPAHEPLCFSCRLGTGVVSPLRDDAGLMADLLGRIPSSNVSGEGES